MANLEQKRLPDKTIPSIDNQGHFIMATTIPAK
jgi:hypothetical protein